jgi:hypothetical protein
MKKIKEAISSFPSWVWMLIILIFFTSEQYVVTIYEAKRIKATESLAPGIFDTTTAARYCGEIRLKRVSGDTAFYWYNCRSSGRKWFKINPVTGPDTLVNLGSLDTLLTNPSTNKYGWKSIAQSPGDGITVPKTIDAVSITYKPTLGVSDSVVTSSTSITTIQTIATTVASSGIIDVYIMGELSDGSDACYVKNVIYYKNVSGTVTITTPATQLAQTNGAGLGSPTIAFSASSANILVRTTPGNSTGTKWKSTAVRVQNIVTP